MQILFLEDQPGDVMLVKRELDRHFPGVALKHARSHQEYVELLRSETFDAVLSDNSIPGCEGLKAFHLAIDLRPGVPFLFVSGSTDAYRDVRGMQAVGVSDLIPKTQLERLAPAVEKAIAAATGRAAPDPELVAGYERLLRVVNELSFARDLPAIMAIVRRTARELTGADGATFILREDDLCHYADEDAIGPLWKGRRFPMHACLSGWVMNHRQPAIVEDIFTDARIPLASYEPTFVRSVIMVPIRSMEPLGAIGNYWSAKRTPKPWEVRLLQALADTTAVAMENVRTHAELEQRVRHRTEELEAYSYAVSHDLRAPLRHIRACSAILAEEHAEEMNEGMRYNVIRILGATARMGEMIDGLMQLHITSRTPLQRTRLDLAEIAREVARDCADAAAQPVQFLCPASLPVEGDPALLRLALQNLLGNAWKFTGKTEAPRVELGAQEDATSETVYFVRDNGAGYDEEDASRLFGVFQRLHRADEFPGTGIGLATVQRIILKHGGRVWAHGKRGEGATFFFTLGKSSSED